jgi:two-component system response regulator FlrC
MRNENNSAVSNLAVMAASPADLLTVGVLTAGITSLNVKSETFKTVDRSYTEMLQLCDSVAKSKATVLISGEAGSGKKSLAELIHAKSNRVSKALITYSCRDYALGEQETKFVKSLEAANGGTLLITEVTDFTSMLQARLFHAIRENMDIRFLVTTSKNIAAIAREGSFREDLYYRLNVVSIKVPSLCDRLGDIELLANEFAVKSARTHSVPLPRLSADAVQMLNGHKWPGNVRELESTIERAVLLYSGNEGGEIRARDLQIIGRSPVSGPNAVAGATAAGLPVAVGSVSLTTWKPGRTLDEIERNVILEALKHHDGNRTHTAKALGISIRTLRNKLAEYRVMGIRA